MVSIHLAIYLFHLPKKQFFGKLWQILANFGKLWQTLANTFFGKHIFWQTQKKGNILPKFAKNNFLANFGKFWQTLANTFFGKLKKKVIFCQSLPYLPPLYGGRMRGGGSILLYDVHINYIHLCRVYYLPSRAHIQKHCRSSDNVGENFRFRKKILLPKRKF